MSGLGFTHWGALAAIVFGVSFCTIDYASAQITPDGTLPNNSSVTREGNTFNITGGTQAGSNLFHSFGEFSVPYGSIASFNNVDVQNIISRITGKSISHIDGLIRANGTANLLLINPNGIIFGKNARLDIGGSFLASTASSLKFPNNLEFNAKNPQSAPLLSINVPIGLQYGTNSGAIQVLGNGQDMRSLESPIISTTSGLQVTSQALTLVGGNISLEGATLKAAGGTIALGNGQDMRSLESPIVSTTSGLQVTSNQTLALVGGNISLEGATLKAAGGTIELGSVTSESFVSLTSISKGFTLGYDMVQSLGNIQLLQQSSVHGGNIQVTGGQITLNEGSQIVARAFGDELGGNIAIESLGNIQLLQQSSVHGGNIQITGREISLNDGSQILARASGDKSEGNITIRASSLSIKNNSSISSNGELPIQAGRLTDTTTSTKKNDENEDDDNEGNGGNITIEAKGIMLFGFNRQTSTNEEREGESSNKVVNGFDDSIIAMPDKNGNIAIRNGITSKTVLRVNKTVQNNTFGITPNRNLVKLSTIVDTKLSQKCEDLLNAERKFTFIDKKSSSFKFNKDIADPNTVEISRFSPKLAATIPEKIVEATGLVINEKGEVKLTANATPISTHASWQNFLPCSVYYAQLNEQIIQFYNQGKYAQAIPLAERNLAIVEKVLGKEHLDVADSLNKLAVLYFEQGNYQKVEPLHLRSLAIIEKIFGTEHSQTAISLNNLAVLYKEQGSYEKAEPLYLRSLKIVERVFGQEHLRVAINLNNLAQVYYVQGKYNKAQPLYLRSIAIMEKALGKEHPDVANILNSLVQMYYRQGMYEEAETLGLRSLAIREKALGKEHPLVGISLNNLAGIYLEKGRYEKAEPLYLRSLAIREKVLGKEHPDVANILNSLGVIYTYQGSYEKAEPLILRSIAIKEKALGKEHLDVAGNLDNLAQLYGIIAELYEKAEPLYLRSLAIREKVLGKEHPDVATNLNNLARLYTMQDKYEKAEPLLLRSLVIKEKTLGKEHPDVALNLTDLALVYLSSKRAYFIQEIDKKAEDFLVRSLAIREKVLGKEHRSVGSSLMYLALYYGMKGEETRTIHYLTRALEVENHSLKLLFAVGSEQRKQDYARTFIESTNLAIALLFNTHVDRSTSAKLGLTTVLQRKGLVLDAVADTIQTLRNQVADKPEIKKLFDEWLSLQQQLSALVYKEWENQNLSEYKTNFKQLITKKEQLEDILSLKSAEFRNVNQPVELAAIQAKIPKDAALVEIVLCSFDLISKPRYVAAVLHSTGEPKWVDLGEVATIDESVTNLRKALARDSIVVNGSTSKRRQSVKQLAQILYKQVMAPIRPLLGNARHLLLSPDGELTVIPFEALTDEQGQYLIQNYAFSYLTSGRDLLRFQSSTESVSNSVVFADIDYEQQETNSKYSSISTVRSFENQRSIELSSLQFEPLNATKEEAQKIKEIFSNTKIISGKQATETFLKHLQSPSILHLATHGFFVPNQETKLKADALSSFIRKSFIPSKYLKLENPLLRSGLALAGFNNRQQTSSQLDDGVLTSLEVAGLNLRGTQLVVLSACQTGLGDVSFGDGVYGLRRALVIAGAQSQVFSLWRVNDEATKDLMVKYYQGLKAGKGRHEALRAAQLELLNMPQYQHPYFWAGFIASGDWTPLSMVEQP